MKRLAKIRVWSLVITFGLALGLTSVAGAQSVNDPAAALAAFEKVAFGSTQNVEAALALFTDDAVLTVTPAPVNTSGVWTGKEEIRKALQINIQLNVSKVNTGTPVVEGNKVSTNAKLTNNFFKMIGVAPVEFTTVVVAEGGKIKSYTNTMLASEQSRVGAATKAYQAANPVQQPGLPNSCTGQQASQSGLSFDLTMILSGLLVVGLLSIAALFFVRRPTHQPK